MTFYDPQEDYTDIVHIKLRKSSEYVNALVEMGYNDFKYVNQQIYVNGLPLDHTQKAIMRWRLRDAGYLFSRGWLNDVIICLAYGSLSITGEWLP